MITYDLLLWVCEIPFTLLPDGAPFHPPSPPGQPEAAATATLEAIARRAPGAVLERAKLLWQMGKQHRAIEELQGALRG